MKSNEIIQEGPLDFVKRVGAGVKGAMDTTSDFRTGYQQAGAQQKMQDMVRRTYPAWNQAVMAYRNQDLPEPEIAKRMQAWTQKYFGVAMPPYPEAMVTAQGAQKYLLTAVGKKMTGDNDDAGAPQQAAAPAQGAAGAQGAQPAASAQQPAAAAQPAAATQGAQQPAQAQQPAAATPAKPAGDFDKTYGVPLTAAGAEKFQQLPQDQRVQSTKAAKAAGYTFDNQTGIWSPPAEGGAQPAAAGAEQPAAGAQAGQQPAADPSHAMFKDPAAFKAEWDKFVASSPNYKLIADPALLSTLKTMWMRSGGMKAESKKNKGKRV